MKYYFPAEWSHQQAVVITWPDEETIWKDSLNNIEPMYVQFARAILAFEPLIIVCRHVTKQEHITQLIGHTKHLLRFLIAPYNDLWIRDYGPITLTNGEQTKWIDFTFNSWGNKYPYALDNEVVNVFFQQKLSSTAHYERHDVVLEGGAIETDGLGTLMTTDCIFTQSRNPNLTEEAMTEIICKTLNIDRFIVIKQGYLSGDDTDGHIDTLARFCDPETIAYTSCDDPTDEHYDNLKAMETQLKSLRTREGKPYQLIPLPIPSPKYDDTGRRLPASYANFLIINGAVLCPTYDDPHDPLIIERITKAFPGREIVSIPSLPLIQYNGALHCASMQIPE